MGDLNPYSSLKRDWCGAKAISPSNRSRHPAEYQCLDRIVKTEISNPHSAGKNRKSCILSAVAAVQESADIAIAPTEPIAKLATKDVCVGELTVGKVSALRIVDRLVPGFPMFHLTHCRSAKIESAFLPGFTITSAMERTIHRNMDNHPIIHNMPQTLVGAHKISDFPFPLFPLQ